MTGLATPQPCFSYFPQVGRVLWATGALQVSVFFLLCQEPKGLYVVFKETYFAKGDFSFFIFYAHSTFAFTGNFIYPSGLWLACCYLTCLFGDYCIVHPQIKCSLPG